MIVRSSRRPTPAASSVRPATERRATRRRAWCRTFTALSAVWIVAAVVLALNVMYTPALGAAVGALAFAGSAFLSAGQGSEETP